MIPRRIRKLIISFNRLTGRDKWLHEQQHKRTAERLAHSHARIIEKNKAGRLEREKVDKAIAAFLRPTPGTPIHTLSD